MPPNPPDPAQYPSYQEAVRFLAALNFGGDGQEADFAFQTFDESPSEAEELTTSFHGSLRDHFPQLRRLNGMGAGVHVGIHETNGQGRTEENVTRPRAVFLDFDEGEPPRGLGAVPVSMVVRSVRGPHVYWLLQPGEDLRQWRRVQKAMAARFGSDESATTFTQTMRLPGFMHCKAEHRPVWVEMLEDRRYTLADIVQGFHLQPELDTLAKAEAELAKRKEEARSLAPTRPVESFRGRVDRALAFIANVPGTQDHRNDHIASHVAPIGFAFGIDQYEWADEVVRWAANKGMIAGDFREKEVRGIVASMYRRLERQGAEPFGWRLEQDSDEWKAKQAKREAARKAREADEAARWEAMLAEEPPPAGSSGWTPEMDAPLPAARPANSGRRSGRATARDAGSMADIDLTGSLNLLDLSNFSYGATPPVGDGHPLSLRGNSQRFTDTHGARSRYLPALKTWYLWDGKRWVKDDALAVYNMAQQVVGSIHDLMDDDDVRPCKTDDDLEKARKEELRKAIKSHVKKSETPKGVKDLLEYASWQDSIVVLPDQLDSDDLLFNTDNGVLDVRTLDLGEHDPTLYQTRVAPVGYVPKAQCPRWEAFLDWCMKGDADLIQFLQRAAGYSLTGSVAEQVFFVCFGTGGNGKSTFINALMEIAAGYGRQCSFDMFLASAKSSAAAPNEELLALKDVRLAFASEPDEGARLREDLIKQITGGERISARPLWGKPIEFYPKFTLWFSCNHRPAIRGTDNGIWRRVLLLPWLANIEETPDKKDRHLPEKLVAEYEGILAWAMAGAHEWHKNGLQIPDRVRAATKGYRDEMDTLGDFLALTTIRAPKATVGSSELYKAYCDWCERTNEYTWKQKTFSQRVKERGFQSKRTRAGNVFVGLGLLDSDHQDFEPGQQQLGVRDYEPHYTEVDD
jgi:putative DNA primase/helicase